MKKSGKTEHNSLQESAMATSSQGYFFPAEWEKHDFVFLAWPHDITSFPDTPKAERAYSEIILALQETNSEKVKLFVTGKKMLEKAKKKIEYYGANPDDVDFFIQDYGDVWFRDYGPTFVVNRNSGKIAMVKWRFNAYGNQYPELLKDDKIPEAINAYMKIPVFSPGIFFEGGAMEANGKGVILTTTLGILNSNRNPGLDKASAEKIFNEFLVSINVKTSSYSGVYKNT